MQGKPEKASSVALEGISESAADLCITVHAVSGDFYVFNVSSQALGFVLASLAVQRMPPSQASIPTLCLGSTVLELEKPLGEQGVLSGSNVTYVLQAASAEDVMCLAQKAGQKQNLDLRDQLFWATLRCLSLAGLPNLPLPSKLQSLTFGNRFDESLEQVSLPSTLESLTLGNSFRQSLEMVRFPTGLLSLTFGHCFNQSLEKVSLPSALQSLTFGTDYNRSLEGVSLPGTLQSLTFGHDFNHSLDGVSLPSELRSLAFGGGFNQSMEKVSFPSTLRSLRFRSQIQCKMLLDTDSLPAGCIVYHGDLQQSA